MPSKKNRASNAPAPAVTSPTVEVAKVESPETTKPKGRTKTQGLRKPQVRILRALAKHGSLTRKELSGKAPVDNAFCTEYVGSASDEIRVKNDAKVFPSLVTLGFVNGTVDAERGRIFTITKEGRTELARLDKLAEIAAKEATKEATKK